MLSRRSLLKRLGVIVATVALAPEIAFGVKLRVYDDALVSTGKDLFWTQTSRWARAQSQAYLDWQIYQVTDTAYAR